MDIPSLENFPTSIRELDIWHGLFTRREAIDQDKITSLHKEINQLENDRGLCREIQQILSGLKESWSHIDPGKTCSAYFFLGPTLQRVVVREFLAEGTPICQTPDEWRAYTQTTDLSRYGAKYERVPHWFSVIPLKKATRSHCGECGTSLPIIEEYAQTADGPDGDTWMKRHFIFCLKCERKIVLCERKIVLDTEHHDSRF